MQLGRDRDKEATNKIEQNDKDYNFIIGLRHYLTYNPPMVLSGEKKILTQIYKALAPTNLSDIFSTLSLPTGLQQMEFLQVYPYFRTFS